MGGNFWTLLKSTRVERAFYIVSMLLIPAAFANVVNKDLIILSICCVLLYSVSGIHNSKRDKDHPLPSYYKKFILGLIIVAIFLSLFNVIIFIAVLIELFLGVIYNTISRKILFGDATVLGFSHAAVPIISSTLLVGLDIFLGLKIAAFMYIFFWPIGTIRNQKDAKADIKRNYNTYATKFSDPRTITKILIQIDFLIMLTGFFLFSLSKLYLLFLCIIYLIQIVILTLTDREQDSLAMQLVRFNVLLFSLSFVLGTNANIWLIRADLLLILGFALIAGPDFVKKFKTHK